MESVDEDNILLSDKGESQGSFSETAKSSRLECATWQNFYIDDVLEESGFDSADPNMVIAVWHSFECPVGPWVFDKLEKKYPEGKARSRSDRRLLFDCINCGLSEVFWWLVDPYPWIETGRRKSSSEWKKNGANYELKLLLASEEKHTCESVLNQEMEWLGFEYVIDVIGQELENLLVNDLMGEVANMYTV